MKKYTYKSLETCGLLLKYIAGLYSTVHNKVTDVEIEFNLSAVATLSREKCGCCREETLIGEVRV